MSDQPISSGPHDFDPHKRVCTRCGASVAQWCNNQANECDTGDLDLTGWAVLSIDEKAARRQRYIDQANARQARGKTAAADDFGAINKRLGEIEKEELAAMGSE